jgi:alkanesulfonate monooxygenase SsuD/methylene tetrahydromethanopterin reductase-like flavin-dependent oxidoreductase (luciferase family)
MKFGVLFDFARPPESSIDWQDPYDNMLECLPEAEELGYESAWSASHHVQEDGLCPSPMLPMAAAASVTDEMTLGTGVLLLPLYSPMKLAEDVAVLDNISGGRFKLGVAPGYASEEFEFHDVPREERVGRFIENLHFLEKASTGERFDFEGKFVEVEDGLVTPPTIQDPKEIIWYGVSGEKMLKRAARRNCVQMASPRHTLEELQDHYSTYREEADNVGYDIPQIPIIRSVVIADSEEEAAKIAEPAIEDIYQNLYAAKSAAGDRVLRDDDGNIVTDKSDAALDQIRDRFIFGTPEQAVEEIKRYEEGLDMDHMICWTHMPGVSGEDAMESVRLFADEVMPEFQ